MKISSILGSLFNADKKNIILESDSMPVPMTDVYDMYSTRNSVDALRNNKYIGKIINEIGMKDKKDTVKKIQLDQYVGSSVDLMSSSLLCLAYMNYRKNTGDMANIELHNEGKIKVRGIQANDALLIEDIFNEFISAYPKEIVASNIYASNNDSFNNYNKRYLRNKAVRRLVVKYKHDEIAHSDENKLWEHVLTGIAKEKGNAAVEKKLISLYGSAETEYKAARSSENVKATVEYLYNRYKEIVDGGVTDKINESGNIDYAKSIAYNASNDVSGIALRLATSIKEMVASKVRSIIKKSVVKNSAGSGKNAESIYNSVLQSTTWKKAIRLYDPESELKENSAYSSALPVTTLINMIILYCINKTPDVLLLINSGDDIKSSIGDNIVLEKEDYTKIARDLIGSDEIRDLARGFIIKILSGGISLGKSANIAKDSFEWLPASMMDEFSSLKALREEYKGKRGRINIYDLISEISEVYGSFSMYMQASVNGDDYTIQYNTLEPEHVVINGHKISNNDITEIFNIDTEMTFGFSKKMMELNAAKALSSQVAQIEEINQKAIELPTADATPEDVSYIMPSNINLISSRQSFNWLLFTWPMIPKSVKEEAFKIYKDREKDTTDRLRSIEEERSRIMAVLALVIKKNNISNVGDILPGMGHGIGKNNKDTIARSVNIYERAGGLTNIDMDKFKEYAEWYRAKNGHNSTMLEIVTGEKERDTLVVENLYELILQVRDNTKAIYDMYGNKNDLDDDERAAVASTLLLEFLADDVTESNIKAILEIVDGKKRLTINNDIVKECIEMRKKLIEKI